MLKGKTLKEIAIKLHMSISTVSKALSNDTSISSLTKVRVQNQAREWNYIPNESASHFKFNKSFTVGLIIPDLLDQFYVLAINGIEEIAIKEKYNIIITQSHEDIAKEENLAKTMIRNRVDGVIISTTKNTVDTAFLKEFKLVGIPVVCIVREPQDHSFNYVAINNKEGAFKATDFLIKKGNNEVHIELKYIIRIIDVYNTLQKENVSVSSVKLSNSVVWFKLDDIYIGIVKIWNFDEEVKKWDVINVKLN